MFGESLGRVDDGERDARLEAVELALSWQVWHTLRVYQPCSIRLARQTVETNMRRLLLDEVKP